MAEHLQVSEEIIQELCKTGLLKAKYLYGGWAIPHMHIKNACTL